MKKIVFIVIAILLLAPGSVMAKRGKSSSGAMNVQVREVIVRSAPSYLSPAAGKLIYGATVNVSSCDGSWCQIDSPSGWVPKNTVTKHKVKDNPDQKFSGGKVKQDEVALAGKGFNPQVEAQYRKDNPQLNAAFASVDRMEGYGATDAELTNFRRSGKLN